jgi:site-specific DNA recombinase
MPSATMPSANGHGPKRAILYIRVSSEERAKKGYSLPDQLRELRAYALREGYKVAAEIEDDGWSGAYLERPGLDRVRDMVAGGGVDAVVVLFRDRLARGLYAGLLKKEFAEYGTKLVALNAQTDDSPEGELREGILDQFAAYERSKTAERTRRGKLQKARQGKVIAVRVPNYGFKYNEERDGYEVDEERMEIVRGIIRMIGTEGSTLYAVKRALERQGVPTANGGKFWAAKVLRLCVLDDVYLPHSHEELRAMLEAGQITPEVFGRLDPEKRYGIWWFNRRRTRRTQVAEPGPDGDRVYKKKCRYVYRPKGEWVAVPVPDSGIPREWVDRAREAIRENRAPSAAGRRVWELSGGIIKCAECGYNMMIHSVSAPRAKGRLFYYRCRKRNRDGAEACAHRKCHRADEVEPRVWNLISGLLKDPERLKAGLQEMIEQERAGLRGDPNQEAKAWLDKLAEVDQERRGYLRLAAKGHISDEELGGLLIELDGTREAAETELEALRARREVLEKLERDKEALLESYSSMTPAALNGLDPEERHHVYKMLRLTVEVSPDGSLDVSGVIGDSFVSENQHQGVCVAQDQVQLPEARAVVALDELVALLRQVTQREVFAPGAGGLSAQGPTPA